MIAARALNKRVYTSAGTLDILSDVHLDIQRGETVAIVGVSGSGKSTLLGLLAGLDLPSSGEVFLSRQRLNDLDEDGRAHVRAQLIGFVFQSFQLLPSLTALENVMLPLELAGSAQAAEQAAQLLSRVGLETRLTHYPKQLSGGEQQRVAIARALANGPQLLLADEPTGQLDSQTGRMIMDLIHALVVSEDVTAIVATHDPVLIDVADRVLELSDGRIVADSVAS